MHKFILIFGVCLFSMAPVEVPGIPGDCEVNPNQIGCDIDCAGCDIDPGDGTITIVITTTDDGGDQDGIIGGGTPWCSPANGSANDQSTLGGISSRHIAGRQVPFCTWQCQEDQVAFFFSQGTWRLWGAVIDDNDSGFQPPGTLGSITDWRSLAFHNGLDVSGLPICDSWTTSEPGSNWNLYRKICTRNLVVTPGQIICEGPYNLSVSAQPPCPAVERVPYPRALVGLPVEFSIGMQNASQAADSRAWCEPDLRNFSLEAGWDQLPITPIWDFKDRPWAEEGNQTEGWTVFHTYQTSSWGLPENGPGLEGLLNLPAYQVSVRSFYQPWIKASWEKWINTTYTCEIPAASSDLSAWNAYYACEENRVYCLSLVQTIDNPRCGGWQAQGSGKVLIDLTDFGYPWAYSILKDAVDLSPMPLDFPDVTRICQLNIPVIESQGLLSAP